MAALAVSGSALAAPEVRYRVGGNGANDGSNDVWLDMIKYSQTEIYTDFVGPQAILRYATGGGGANTGHRVVGARNSVGIPDKDVVLDDGDGRLEGDEVNVAKFREHVLMAMQSRNLNYYYDMAGNDPNFSMTLDFSHNPIRNKVVYFERGGGGSNSWLQLEAVDVNGNKIGNTYVVKPRTSTDLNLQGAVYSGGKDAVAQNWSQTISFYDLSVADFGVASISYLRVSMPKGVTLGSGEDLQPDFKIMATRSPVPEPFTMGLLGAAGAAWVARRRKKAA